MQNKKVIVITIPLVCNHGKIYWGLYTQYTGKIKNRIRFRSNAGPQVIFAFEEALKSDADILVVIDDKFNKERLTNEDPSEKEIDDFFQNEPLPKIWLDVLGSANALSRIINPPKELEGSTLGFSERKTYAIGRNEYGLPGECDNTWTKILSHIEDIGYESVCAYIPKVCFKSMCYATPYAQDSGVYAAPIKIVFTETNRPETIEQYWESGKLIVPN